MAEDIDDQMDGGEGAAPMVRSGVNKKKLIMMLLPILLVVGAAVGIYFSGMADSLLSGEDKEASSEAKPAGEGEKKEIMDTAYYDLNEMVVNLNAGDRGRGNLAKIKISLEVESAADFQKLDAVMPSIVDTFLVHLRELRPEELEGSAGMYRLKEELLSRVNKAAKPVKVLDIKFKQFEIQ